VGVGAEAAGSLSVLTPSARQLNIFDLWHDIIMHVQAQALAALPPLPQIRIVPSRS